MVQDSGLIHTVSSNCMHSFKLLERKELISLPAPTCDKTTGTVWEVVGFLTAPKKELIPCQASSKFLLFIPNCKDQAGDKKILRTNPS